MPGFHFCPGTIFKNCSGSGDTTRDITVKKNLFFKNLYKAVYQLKDLKKLSIFQSNSNI